MRDQVHGVTGSGVGAYIIVPGMGYESSSGGPFFRGKCLFPYSQVVASQTLLTINWLWPQTLTTKEVHSKSSIGT